MEPSDTALKKSLPPRRNSQLWTTTRCHRLLRPLRTNVSALRREIELENNQRLSQDPNGNTIQDSTGTSFQSGSKVQHTYSKRGRRPKLPNDGIERSSSLDQVSGTSKVLKLPRKLQPGEIILPTPVIRRARGHQLLSPLQQPRWTDLNDVQDGKKRFTTMRAQRNLPIISELEMELQLLRSQICSTKLSLYESLLRALYSLLTATSEPPLSSRGCKSLMSMCLRKLPEYIDELEYWEQLDAEEQGTKSTLHNSKVSSEIYEEIENLLPPSRNGCPPLRQLVRAHGLRLIRNAMAEELLDPKFALILIKLCSSMKAYSEAECLLGTLFELDITIYPKPKSMDSTFEEGRKLAPLRMLRDFAKESERPKFMLRQLSGLMCNGRLPLEWLSTKEFVSIWAGVVRTLSGHGVCDDTTSFAVHAITALVSQAKRTAYSLKPQPTNPRALSQQTLLSTISTVATLPLLRHDDTSPNLHGESQDDTSVTSQRVVYVIQSCLYELERPRKPTWITTVLNLGAFYASMPHHGFSRGKGVSLDIMHAGNGWRDARQHREAAIALICTLAQFLGRGTSEASHNFLVKLLNRLETALPGGDTVPSDLRAECAFFLAERTLDLRDLAFAEAFNEHADRKIGVNMTPTQSASTSTAKFWWDEGIAEWVTVTPAVSEKQAPPRRSLRSRRSRSNIETGQGAGTEPDNRSVSCVRDLDDDDDDTASEGSTKHVVLKQGTKQVIGYGGKAGVAVPYKRKLKNSLIMQSSDEDEKGQCNVANVRNRPACGAQDKEGDNDSSSGRGPPRKRRAAALKPYRSILKGRANTGGAESSEDELGL